jgi:hypothetical protein
VRNGLIAEYDLNGNGDDSAGQNPLTLSNVVFGTDRFGVTNACLQFDSDPTRWAESQTVIDSNVLDNFTMSIWANFGGMLDTNNWEHGTNGSMLLQASQGTPTYGSGHAGVGILGGTNGVVIWEHADGYIRRAAPVIAKLTGWNQVVVIYSNQTPFVFINGKLAGTDTANSNYHYHPSSGETLTAAQWYVPMYGGLGLVAWDSFDTGNYNALYSFSGSLDDFRIYNRALSSNEVNQLYLAQSVPGTNGVAIGLFPGVTITGIVGRTYIIQSSPDLSNPSWTNAATITLTQPQQIWNDNSSDVSKPGNPQKFYQVVPSN